MLPLGLPPALWSVLYGHLWHATKCVGLTQIISDREIKPDMGDRYKKSFCRLQDSVCLFDFGPTASNIQEQYRNWSGWFGHQQNSRIAIWLKIDRVATNNSLLDAGAARERWGMTEHKGGFIPGVEACHDGPIPLDAVSSALLVARDNKEVFQQCCLQEISQQIKNFKRRLPPPRKD